MQSGVLSAASRLSRSRSCAAAKSHCHSTVPSYHSDLQPCPVSLSRSEKATTSAINVHLVARWQWTGTSPPRATPGSEQAGHTRKARHGTTCPFTHTGTPDRTPRCSPPSTSADIRAPQHRPTDLSPTRNAMHAPKVAAITVQILHACQPPLHAARPASSCSCYRNRRQAKHSSPRLLSQMPHPPQSIQRCTSLHHAHHTRTRLRYNGATCTNTLPRITHPHSPSRQRPWTTCPP